MSVSEGLKAVLDAEKQVRGRTAQAQRAATVIQEEAAAKARSEYETAYGSAVKKLDAELEAVLKNARSAAEKESQRGGAEVELKIAELKKLADRNMKKAVNEVFKAVVSTSE